jgi:hypothetical protein
MNATGRHEDSDKHRLVLKVLARLRCVHCSAPYDPHDFVQIHRWQDVWVLGIQCRQCGEQSHVIVALALDAPSEPVIDFTEEELEAAKGWQPITADDVLDMHMLLQEFEGDLTSILSN